MSVLIPKMKVLLCITELKAAGRACVGDYFILMCVEKCMDSCLLE